MVDRGDRFCDDRPRDAGGQAWLWPVGRETASARKKANLDTESESRRSLGRSAETWHSGSRKSLKVGAKVSRRVT